MLCNYIIFYCIATNYIRLLHITLLYFVQGASIDSISKGLLGQHH